VKPLFFDEFRLGVLKDGMVVGHTFYQMKSRDTFAPLGPYLVTADEVPDPHRLQIRLWGRMATWSSWRRRAWDACA
jgi:hypothetical protein